jgi:hypothetical protein
LAGRAYVYPAGSDTNTPLMAIHVSIRDDRGPVYTVKWFPDSGEQPLTGGRKIEEGAGVHAAHVILDQLFAIELKWRDNPPRRAFYKGSGDKPIGFRLEP